MDPLGVSVAVASRPAAAVVTIRGWVRQLSSTSAGSNESLCRAAGVATLDDLDEFLYLAADLATSDDLRDCVLLNHPTLFGNAVVAGVSVTAGGRYGGFCYPCEATGVIRADRSGTFGRVLADLRSVTISVPDYDENGQEVFRPVPVPV